jgi:1-deoxy-D-xylulose-5-phosphate reductoisomerase
MKKKIAILGSTGSIGKSTIDILRKDKKNFDVVLLTTNNNYREILKQAKEFKARNIIINNKKHFLTSKKKLRNNKINIFNNFQSFNNKFKSKIDFSMSAISGLEGLKPTLDLIKFSKTIAIANKESIICAWNLIQQRLNKYKTKFIPVDSEHFSIWSLLDGNSSNSVEEIIITASGGPFLKLSLNKFKKIKPQIAVNHPNWKMGKKISIDSATMMNKVFEVIEAQRIFNIDINKFKILIHPKSYVHAIVKFTNGLTKILVHDTDMKIPIFNSIYGNNNKKIKSSKINLSILNNLNFIKVNSTRFPSIKILKMIPNKISLYETVMVSANDQLVSLFLDGKINFSDVARFLKKIMKMNIFMKYKKITPKNFNELINLSKFVRLKTNLLSVRSNQ